jgi:CRP-like cAMP-binding protein/DNA-binding NarL/FixJ family response regulator
MTSAKVLVVEDEDAVATDIIESLIELGFEIVGRASSYEGAVDLCEVERPEIILMDIKLEGHRDGIEVANQIGLSHPDCPVIYLTAYADEETLARAKVTEPYGYLIKPYKEIDLRMTIEVALQKAKASMSRRSSTNGSQQRGADDGAPATSESVGSVSHRIQATADKEVCAEALQFFKQIDSFQSVTEDDLRYLAAHAVIREHSAGEYITHEGDVGDRGFVVLSGRVAMLKSSSNGRDLIVELLPPADLLGLIVCLNKMPYPYSTRAQVDSRLIWIERLALYELLEIYPELSKKFINEAFGRLRRSHEFSQLLAHEKVEVRIAVTLLALLPRFSEDESGAVVVRMTRLELAELSGTTQETCIRVTRKMEKAGILDLSENKTIVVINENALRELAMTDHESLGNTSREHFAG